MQGCVVLSFGEGFGKPGAVAAASAAAHLPPGAEVVVATTGLGAESMHMLHSGVERNRVPLTVIESNAWVRRLPVVSRYVADTWTRVFTAEWLPERFERVVYLDADTLTVGDLAELFSLGLDSDLAALPDPVFTSFGARGSGYAEASGLDPSSPYFNTGVLVFDRSRWVGVASAALDLVGRGRLPLDYVDQDVLNVVMHRRWQELSPRWHRLLAPDDDVPDGAVLHFTGSVKPWAVDCEPGAAARRYRAAATALGWAL